MKKCRGDGEVADGNHAYPSSRGHSGNWRIVVSSDDLFAAGDYVLHLYCYNDDFPGVPAGCVSQYLLCGQTGWWTLNADSCRFQSSSRAYAAWEIYAVKGDVLNFEETSTAFEPLFGIYQGATLLRSSTRESVVKHTMRYTVPETDWYTFLATTTEDNRGGDFSVRLSCSTSGCTFPYLLNPIPTTIAPYGTSVTLRFAYNVLGADTTATLRHDGTAVATSKADFITTPIITKPETFVLELDNACGGWDSDPFVVRPDHLPRRRAVRK